MAYADGRWRLTAVLSVIGSILPLFDVYPIDALTLVLVAGVLDPVWPVWLASRARETWPAGEFPPPRTLR